MIRRICYFIIFISTVCFLFSCSEKKKTELNLPISEDTMASIMKDMQKANYMLMLAENDTSQTHNDSVKIQQMKADYKKTICNHYNTNPQTYDSCLNVYLQHGEIMQRILKKAKQ